MYSGLWIHLFKSQQAVALVIFPFFSNVSRQHALYIQQTSKITHVVQHKSHLPNLLLLALLF